MKDNNPYRSTVLQPKRTKPLGNRSLSMSAWVCACLAGLLYLLRLYAEMTNGMNNKLALSLGVGMWSVALVGSLLSMRAPQEAQRGGEIARRGAVRVVDQVMHRGDQGVVAATRTHRLHRGEHDVWCVGVHQS